VKQFVVNDGKSADKLACALHWFKQNLIGGLNERGRLVINWTLNERRGILTIDSFELTRSSLDIIRQDAITIDGIVKGETSEKLNNFTWSCAYGNLYTIEWEITNIECNIIFKNQMIHLNQYLP
jgi:hypothetical protein